MPIKLWKFSTIPKKWIENRIKMKWGMTRELESYVEYIVKEVRERGDTALVEFTKKFDGANLNAKDFRVGREEIKEAYNAVSEKQVEALCFMKRKLEMLERRIMERATIMMELEGATIHIIPKPIPSVGCYVPGGTSAYPSTLVMTVTPAKVAGVPRVVVCSPPNSSGTVNPLTLVAADICGADEIYKVGGAQAIAALAYGTKSIRPVGKIVGPGNIYVTMAKIIVSRDVAIDVPAGPSEVLILADETADARFVALDMASQAEHGVYSISGLVTTSKKFAEKVKNELETISSPPQMGKVAAALSKCGFIIICENLDEAIEFVNAFAPEHLEIVTKNSAEVAQKVTSAGLILVGPYSPVSASDYCIGTNHVLPTSGFGKVFSGLSVLDFVRRISLVECSKDGLSKLREHVKVLAEAENLPNHYLAVEGRFKFE
jgi:histidinol dehydrogenase